MTWVTEPLLQYYMYVRSLQIANIQFFFVYALAGEHVKVVT